MRCTFILICLLTFITAIAQKKKVLKKVEKDLKKEHSQWYDGSIELWVNDEKIYGSIQYDDRMQVLSFKWNGSEPEVLKPSEVKGFEFFDDENGIPRSFIAIDSNNFYEILVQAKYFALLLKITPLEPIIKSASQGYHDPYTNMWISLPGRDVKTELGQEVTLLFYDLHENLFPAIRATKIERERSTEIANNPIWDRFTYKKIPDSHLDEKLLSQMMGGYFPEVKKYMRTYRLNKNNIEDLIKIVEYLKQLEATE
jgi:hypothetical protein